VRALLLITALVAAYLFAAHLSGGRLYDFGLGLGGEKATLQAQVSHFWEDVKFKDFAAAARYHSPETQAQVDIPYLIERLFLIKPEALEIISMEVMFVEIDSTGRRARVKQRVKVKDLMRQQVEQRELILYFHKPAEQWYMELESSLRGLDADPDKKH